MYVQWTFFLSICFVHRRFLNCTPSNNLIDLNVEKYSISTEIVFANRNYFVFCQRQQFSMRTQKNDVNRPFKLTGEIFRIKWEKCRNAYVVVKIEKRWKKMLKTKMIDLNPSPAEVKWRAFIRTRNASPKHLIAKRLFDHYRNGKEYFAFVISSSVFLICFTAIELALDRNNS